MPVQHDPATRRFTLAVRSGTAELLYVPAGPGVLEYYSTFVPPADRGQGIANQLVEAAVGYARAQGIRIVPSCWFVARWLEAHPEHADLISS
jgi:uncharacterized protein